MYGWKNYFWAVEEKINKNRFLSKSLEKFQQKKLTQNVFSSNWADFESCSMGTD
jgi:hypothetical protein